MTLNAFADCGKRKRRDLLMEPPPPPQLELGAPLRSARVCRESGAANGSRCQNDRQFETSDSSHQIDTSHNQRKKSSSSENLLTAEAAQENSERVNFLTLTPAATVGGTTNKSSNVFHFQAAKRSDSKCRTHHPSDKQFVINDDGDDQSASMWRSLTRAPNAPLALEKQIKMRANKSRRKNELTSFLTILFGSLLFALAALTLNCDSQNHTTATTISTQHATSPLVGGDLLLATTPARHETASSKKVAATTGRNTGTNFDSHAKPAKATPANETSAAATSNETKSEAESEGGGGGEHEKSADELADDEDNQTPADKTKLAELVVDSASSGVDLLVSRLAGSGAATSEAPSESDGDEEASENSADNERLELADAGTKLDDITSGRVDADTPSNSSTTKNGAELNRRSPAAAAAAAARNEARSLDGSEDEMSFGPEHAANKFAMSTWLKWRATGDDLIELFARKLLPVIMRHGYDVDAATVSGLLQVFNGIRGLKPWALKLLDASTKLAPGLLIGTQSDFGDFDECLNVRVDDPSGLAQDNADFPTSIDEATGLKSTTLVGRYCLADVEFPKPARGLRSAADRERQRGVSSNQSEPVFEKHLPIELRRTLLNFSETAAFKETIFVETANFFHMLYVDPIRVGICLTNKIDPDSAAQVLNKLLEEFAVSIHFRGRCVTKYDRPKWTVFQRCSANILLIACSLVVLSTLLDLLQLKLAKLPGLRRWPGARAKLAAVAHDYRPLYTSFSLLRNTKRLFKPQKSNTSSIGFTQQQQQQQQQQQRAQLSGAQFKLNLSANGTHLNGKLFTSSSAASVGSAPSLATTTSSVPESSVESSPIIERRSLTQSLATNGPSGDNSIMELLMADPRLAAISKLPATPTAAAAAAAAGCLFGTAQGSSSSKKVRDSNEISLLCLHGVRVITMVWMIVNHTYMFGGFFVLWAHRRLIDIAEWPKSLSFQMVLNGWLTVETYFFLSALIIVLNVMPLMRRSKFNYFAYIFHRLLRLLPAYIGLVCLNFLWPLVSSGPVWLVKGKSFVEAPCENYLWTNFLFVNNWIWPEKQCMVHTWFLSADFQLYILAPIIVYLLYRRPALGHTLNILVAILASILSGFVIYANKLLPTTLINKLEFDAIKQQLSYSYFATYQHMGPYCLGILTGYLLHKRPHIKLPSYITWLLWLLLPPLSFTTLLLTYLWNGAYDDPALINPSPLVSAFYVAIHRTIWTALVAWIVFACTTGRAKLLSQLLSHSIFIPISRLSYSIYLVHLPIIMFRSLNLRHTVEWTDQNILYEACGNFVASLIMGYFLNVTFESPIINLENYISGRDRPRKCVRGNLNMNFENLRNKQADENQMIDADSSSATGETSSSHSVEPSRPLVEDRLGSSAGAPSNCDTNGRKSLRPKQASSVERIFGEIQAQDGEHPSDSFSSGCSKYTDTDEPALASSLLANQMAHKPLEPSGNNKEQMKRDKELIGKSQQDEQKRAKPVRRQLDHSNGHGNGIYNQVSDEYQHYAPGGYKQWRMYMNNGGHAPPPPSQANGYSRPMHYATLARSTRLSHQSRSMLDGRRIPHGYQDKVSAYADPHRAYSSGAHFQSDLVTSSPNETRPDGTETDLANQMNLGRPLGSSRRRHLEYPLVSRTQAGRYNTLNGTRARDLRSQYSQLTSSTNLVDDLDWDKTQAWQDSVLRPGNSLTNGPPTFWLRQGPMIPRIDSSTLRRQARRAVDNGTTDGSIVEETLERKEGTQVHKSDL